MIADRISEEELDNKQMNAAHIPSEERSFERIVPKFKSNYRSAYLLMIELLGDLLTSSLSHLILPSILKFVHVHKSLIFFQSDQI